MPLGTTCVRTFGASYSCVISSSSCSLVGSDICIPRFLVAMVAVLHWNCRVLFPLPSLSIACCRSNCIACIVYNATSKSAEAPRREGGPSEDQRGWVLMWHCQITRGVKELALITILPSQTHLACACDDFRYGPYHLRCGAIHLLFWLGICTNT